MLLNGLDLVWSFYWTRHEVNVTVFEPRSEPLDGIELSRVGNALAKRWLLRDTEILLKNKRLGPSLEESIPFCVAVARVSYTPSLHALLLGSGVWEKASQPGSLFVPRAGCGKKYGMVLGFWLSHVEKQQLKTESAGEGRQERGPACLDPRCSWGKAWCGACSSLLLDGIQGDRYPPSAKPICWDQHSAQAQGNIFPVFGTSPDWGLGFVSPNRKPL